MKIIHTAGAMLCLGIPAAGFAAQKPKQEAPRPNIVILIADDVSMNDFSCYGHPVIKTPNIDALARDGIRFTNTFLTASSSSPSRSSIITGRYPHNTGAAELHSPMGNEQFTVAELLRKSGYYCGQAGKWHFGAGEIGGPALRGFDRTGGSVQDGGGESGSKRWVEWLEQRDRKKPFFMWFASHDAHRGWDNDQSLPRYAPEGVYMPRFYVNDAQTREDIACYYYEVSRFDYNVGLVVAELGKEGVLENTLIIVMADNGRPFPRSKTRLITEGIKTPFVIHYPRLIQKPGSVCNSLVSTIDIAPTLAAAAGIEPAKTFQGRSFLGLLSDPSKKFRTWVFAEHNWHDFEAYERMICNEKYLLIENKRPNLNAEGAIDVMGGGTGLSLLAGNRAGTLDSFQADIFVTPRPEIELYEWQKDRDQLDNLASKLPAERKIMLDKMHLWQQETCDNVPENLTHDWYSRETLKKLPDYSIRREMPGAALAANMTTNPGPF